MRALLLILIPLLTLAGVMTFVFWAAGSHTEESAEEAAQVAKAPTTGAGKPAPATRASTRPGPTTRFGILTSMPTQALGAATSQAAAVADSVDEMANLARSRIRRDQSAQLTLAKAALATSRPGEAIAACDRVLGMTPNQLEALSTKAAALSMLGRYEQAAEVCEKAARIAPEDVVIRYNYGVLLSRLKRNGEAIREYEAVLKLQPDHAKAGYNLAVILEDEGKLSDAAGRWERLCKGNPDLADAWARWGSVALQLSDYENAVTALERADKLKPGQVDIAANLGTAYQGVRRWTDAIRAYERAIGIRKDCLPAINGMADVYLSYFERHVDATDLFDNAMEWCKASFRITPDQPRLANLYRRAIKARPDSLSAINGLIQALAVIKPDDPQYLKCREEILGLCRKSLEINANQPDIKAVQGRLKGDG